MQERGPAAYVAEFIGTLLLVFFITAAVSLFVTQPTPQNPAPFIDFTVIALVHTFALFVLIQVLAVVSGAHVNPAVTVAMTLLRQIRPSDAAIYVVAQLAGGIAGALLTKLLLTEFANAETVNFGAGAVSDRLGEKDLLGMLGEFIGAFILMFAIVGAAIDPRIDRALAPLCIGAALGLAVFVMGPLTGASFNPARALGPALVGEAFDGAGTFLLVYVLAPVLGAVSAGLAAFYVFVAPGQKGVEGMEPVG